MKCSLLSTFRSSVLLAGKASNLVLGGCGRLALVISQGNSFVPLSSPLLAPLSAAVSRDSEASTVGTGIDTPGQ